MAEMSTIRYLLKQHIIQDLFTIVYTVVDDYLKLSHERQRFKLSTSTQQKASYAEIMTIALIGELLREPHSEHWFIKVKLGFKPLFQALPHITQYHRILKNLEGIMADFGLCLANTVDDETVYAIDSKPLPVCRDKRRFQPRAMTEAARGFSTMGPTYGFKLHAVMNNAQMTCRFAIVPATLPDRCVLGSRSECFRPKSVSGFTE